VAVDKSTLFTKVNQRGNLMHMTSDSIENLSSENRTFAPSSDFAAAANAKADLYAQADADRLKFWEEQANALTWDKKWETVLDCQVVRWRKT
jgi:hypothetical protein